MQANLFFLSHISFIFQHFSQPLKCSRRGQPQFFISWSFFHLCLEVTSISFLFILDPCYCRSYLCTHFISSHQTHVWKSICQHLSLLQSSSGCEARHQNACSSKPCREGQNHFGFTKCTSGMQAASLFRFSNLYVAK